MKDMIVKLVFSGDATRMDTMLRQSERRLKSFGGVARREFDHIKSAANSLQGKLAALGLSVGAVMLVKQSAALDQSLTRIGQTASMSQVQVTGLRKEFFRMARETGQSVESLQDGFNTAVQSGLQFKQALPVIDAVNKAAAVTGASTKQLTDALTVAAQVYHFDLSNPKAAVELLDKMTVAGRAGNAELEDLSGIYSRVAMSAKRSGMNNDQALAFIETLSLVEKMPERLSTLADSTLRLFTNPQYLIKAQKATGVNFFDENKQRRDPLSVLRDIMKKYQTLQNDTERMIFKRHAFQGADLDTQKGLELLFDKQIGALEKTEAIVREIEKAPGQIKKDLPEAIRNAEAQANRLKATLREAADGFSVVLNRGITKGIKKLLDSKEEGGMDLSGKEIAGYGAAALGLGYIGYRVTGGALKKLLGHLGGTGAGIAEGKAIEYATGVTPVFVVNMPGSGIIPGMPGGKPPAGNIPNIPGGPTSLLALLSGTVAMLAGASAVGYSFYKVPGLSGAPQQSNGINKFSDEQERLLAETAQWGREHGMNVQNDITLNLRFDRNFRAISDSSDPHTRVSIDLNRGSWDNPLGAN